MAKGRKSTPKVSVEKTETIKETPVQEVVVEETIVTEEPVKEETVTEEVMSEVVTEEPVIEEPSQTKEMFTMDISDYGVKLEEAEKFVKTAIKFYFENKDKQLVELSSTKEKETVENITNTTDMLSLMNKINTFEKGLFKYSYLPKNMVVEFIKDLKK